VIKPKRTWDLWSVPTWVLWLAFLLVGLFPEPFYQGLRDIARVASQDALVNSPLVLTMALSIYLGLFVYRRCREVSVSPAASQGRALQVAVVALVAFLPFPYGLLYHLNDFPTDAMRAKILLIGGAKSLAWLYVFHLFFRYYVLGEAQAFAGILCLFPSSYEEPDIVADQQRDHPSDEA